MPLLPQECLTEKGLNGKFIKRTGDTIVRDFYLLGLIHSVAALDSAASNFCKKSDNCNSCGQCSLVIKSVLDYYFSTSEHDEEPIIDAVQNAMRDFSPQ